MDLFRVGVLGFRGRTEIVGGCVCRFLFFVGGYLFVYLWKDEYFCFYYSVFGYGIEVVVKCEG